MRLYLLILMLYTLLSACAQRPAVEPADFTNIREFALADMKASVPVLDRMVIYPETFTDDRLSELKISGVYGDLFVKRLGVFCTRSNKFFIDDINDIFGTHRLSLWLDAMNRMSSYAKLGRTFDPNKGVALELGEGIKIYACSRDTADPNGAQPQLDIIWYVFRMGRASQNSITKDQFTVYHYLIEERCPNVPVDAFNQGVVDRLNVYQPKGSLR